MDRLVEKVRQAAEAAASGLTGSYADVPQAVREAWDAFVRALTTRGAPKTAVDRDALGRLVREVWIVWARENPMRCAHCQGLGTRAAPRAPSPDALVEPTPGEHARPALVTCPSCNGAGKYVKASWLVPWDQLSEEQRDVDRRIGEAVGVYTLALAATLPTRFSHDSFLRMHAVLATLRGKQEP